MVSSCDGSIIIMTLNFMYFYLFAFPCTQKKKMYATIDFFLLMSDRTLFVSNALIHMHSKCGRIDKARSEFNRMSDRDVISYSALITALSDHGKAHEALDLFTKMQKEGISPNQVTFIGVLNACSHAGLIEEGCKYFELMTEVFGIELLNEHRACMVDLFGRAR